MLYIPYPFAAPRHKSPPYSPISPTNFLIRRRFEATETKTQALTFLDTNARHSFTKVKDTVDPLYCPTGLNYHERQPQIKTEQISPPHYSSQAATNFIERFPRIKVEDPLPYFNWLPRFAENVTEY